MTLFLISWRFESSFKIKFEYSNRILTLDSSIRVEFKSRNRNSTRRLIYMCWRNEVFLLHWKFLSLEMNFLNKKKLMSFFKKIKVIFATLNEN